MPAGVRRAWVRRSTGEWSLRSAGRRPLYRKSGEAARTELRLYRAGTRQPPGQRDGRAVLPLPGRLSKDARRVLETQHLTAKDSWWGGASRSKCPRRLAWQMRYGRMTPVTGSLQAACPLTTKRHPGRTGTPGRAGYLENRRWRLLNGDKQHHHLICRQTVASSRASPRDAAANAIAVEDVESGFGRWSGQPLFAPHSPFQGMSSSASNVRYDAGQAAPTRGEGLAPRPVSA